MNKENQVYSEFPNGKCPGKLSFFPINCSGKGK